MGPGRARRQLSSLGKVSSAVVLSLTVMSLLATEVEADEGAGDRPSRAEYVGRIEPICKRNIDASKRILSGVRRQVKNGELTVAGERFIRASNSFARILKRIAAVPRPPSDENRLMHWVAQLGVLRRDLRRIGLDLKQQKKVKASHDEIRAERAGNAANNIGFVFEFHYCQLDFSSFS